MSIICFSPNSGGQPTVVRDFIVRNVADSTLPRWGRGAVADKPKTIRVPLRAPLLIARGSSVAEDCRSGEGRHPSISPFFKSRSRAILFYDSHCCLKLSQQSLQHPEVSSDNVAFGSSGPTVRIDKGVRRIHPTKSPFPVERAFPSPLPKELGGGKCYRQERRSETI